MSKRIWQTRLRYKLIYYLVFSFLISVACFVLLSFISLSWLDQKFNRSSYATDIAQDVAAEFQSYVTNNGFSLADGDELLPWFKQQKGVYIQLYYQDTLIADSAGFYPEILTYLLDRDDYLGYNAAASTDGYTIDFSDAQVDMEIWVYSQDKYYYLALSGSLFISFCVFLIIYTCLIKKRFNYIQLLEQEMKIIEEGDLNHSITVLGNDELGSLAQSMEDMRLAFIRQLAEKDRAREANTELISALSHDLRTPLTTQIGYFDLLAYGKAKTPQQQQEYIEKCREKAYQMKSLTDQLFRYFLAYDESGADATIDLEEYNGNETIAQLTEEHVCLLEERGFTVQTSYEQTPFQIWVNMDYMCRIYDNLFSNIDKYADKDKPVEIRYKLVDERIQMFFLNKIDNKYPRPKSTKIGLQNIRKMLLKQNGAFYTVEQDGLFIVEISLPAAMSEDVKK